MELVPEEKLVVITTEKPILSPSNENMEETMFPVDFDVDSSLEIEVMLTNMHQFVVPGEKYPQKLILENGLVTLPDPVTFVKCDDTQH